MSMLTEDMIAKCLVLAMGGNDGVIYCTDKKHAEARFTKFCQMLVDMGDRGACTKDINRLVIDFNPGSIRFMVSIPQGTGAAYQFHANDRLPHETTEPAEDELDDPFISSRACAGSNVVPLSWD